MAEVVSTSLVVSENDEIGQGNYLITLEPLQKNTLYQLTCKINNPGNINSKLVFEPRLLSSSRYTNVQLNGKALASNTGYLQSGKNILSFLMVNEKDDTERYNRFILNSNSYPPIQVTQCAAQKISPNDKSQTKNSVSTQLNSGYFFAFNDTDRPVTIAVGNFLPIEYNIAPHDWLTVFVSSDNQNIHIKQIK